MPAIALPPHAHRTHAPRDGRPGPGRSDPGRPSAAEPSLALRARVALRRRSLTRALSDGADPAGSPGLALRARQLTSDRARRELGRSLRRAVFDAHHPAPSRCAVGLMRRGAVIEAEDLIDLLVKRLRSPVPVSPEGAALVQRMLNDGPWSPMYSPAGAGALRWLVRLATIALEPIGA